MAGSTIGLAKAREIAGDWHGGQMSGLYSLASWPGITPDNTIIKAAREVDREIADLQEFEAAYQRPFRRTEQKELAQLRRYLAAEAKSRGLDQ